MSSSQWLAAITLSLALCAAAIPVAAQEETLSREEVLTLLAERDAIIIELENTVRELRERLDAVERLLANDAGPESALPSSRESPFPGPAIEPSPLSGRDDPTQLVVDEAAAERALERTLVQTGALLLPRGTIELVPALSLDQTDTDFPVTTMVGTELELGSTNLDRSASIFSLTARFGLPADSQLEIGIPYVSVTEVAELSAPGAPVLRSDETGRGVGDFSIGVAKTLRRESGRWPDLVGRLSWSSGEGDESDGGIVLGGGFEAWSGSLSAVKRRDPLVMFLTLGYTDTRAKDGVEPGDQLSLSFGTGLALSPESSIFGSISHRAITETRVAEQELEGSDFNVTTLDLGLTTILRRGTLLSLFTEIGLSEDAPDYSLGFSMPVRW